jgi:hypothetical protein
MRDVQDNKVLVPTKTRSGRRQIKLGRIGLAMLEAHRQRQEAQKTLAGWMPGCVC